MNSNKMAFIFPGQGSQQVGMLSAAAKQFPEVEQTFAQASEILNYDLWALSQQGPQEQLNLTETTQPLLLTASVALWRAWLAAGGPKPDYVAGHSLGEFSALVCSGVLAFEDAVDLVSHRGAFMQSAVPVGVGAMAAIIGLADEKVEAVCASCSETQIVQAVNYNSPGQVVIAGHAEAVAQAIEGCKAAGAKRGLPLPVSAPFHTSLMQVAGEQLSVLIHALNFSAPEIPIVHNVTAKTESDPDKIKALMVEQIYNPVQWTRCTEFMVSQGVDHTVECGPGKVLSGLSRRIHKPLTTANIELPDALLAAVASR